MPTYTVVTIDKNGNKTTVHRSDDAWRATNALVNMINTRRYAVIERWNDHAPTVVAARMLRGAAYGLLASFITHELSLGTADAVALWIAIVLVLRSSERIA